MNPETKDLLIAGIFGGIAIGAAMGFGIGRYVFSGSW